MQELVAVVVAGPDLGVRANLGDGVEIGNAPGSHMQLTDPSVSECQLRISGDGSGLQVDGQASGPGIRLNGRPLTEAHPLSLGDQLLVGATVIEVVSADAAATSPARSPLRVQPSTPAFVPPEFLEEAAPDGRSRYGALGSWTDSRVKFQTSVAASGLLAVSAVAVYLFVL